MIHLGQRIDVEPKRFIAVAANRENSVLFFSRELLIELGIKLRHFLNRAAFVFSEINDDLALIDDASDRASVG